MRNLTLGLLLIGCLVFGGCKKELSATGDPTTVTLQFTDVVGIVPLTLGTVYMNSLNETFNVSSFKYYISNIQLFSRNGSVQHINGIYHLVDASDSTTMTVSFPAIADSLTAFSFLVGVDSAKIASGDHSGDLNPSKGMYWSKGAGYIMAELEGVSPLSSAPGYQYQFQIGGYTGPDNVLRRVTIALPGPPINLNPILPDTLYISLDADVDAWFNGPNFLPLTMFDTCIAPGPLASKYADNYARMFTLRNVQVK